MNDLSTYSVWTAVVTPMNEDSSVNYDDLKSVLQAQAAAGNAITILGSTGESLNIDESEKRQILEFAIDLKLGVPLMVGVGGINLNTQLEWIDYLNTLEVDNYLLVVPLYAKPGAEGQYGWFKALLDRANKPCTLYNVPGRTAAKMSLTAVKKLSGHPNFWGIKEASGSAEEFVEYSKAAPQAVMLSGDDPLLPAFSKLGAKGVISVAANVWPVATHEIANQCLEGTFKDDDMWSQATAALFCASNPVPVKALMSDLGQIKTPELRLPLSSKDMLDIDVARDADASVQEWLAKQ